MRIPLRCTALAGMAVLAACHHAPPGPAPVGTGHALLGRMHAQYRDTWYHTLTFVQKTTRYRAGAADTTTWYESLKAPDRLRIDFSPLSAGNGSLYTADSEVVMRSGRVSQRVGTGNPLVPLIEGVYVQPVAVTERQLAPYGFALDRLYTRSWEGRDVYVVGAVDSADTTSAQFWVDAERLVLVRMLAKFSADGPVIDSRIGGYQQLAGPSWLATHNEFWILGQVRQAEDYSSWRINIELPDALFDPAQWTTVRHWAAGRQP